MPAKRESNGHHDRKCVDRMSDLGIIHVLEGREPERDRRLAGLHALEQTGASVPVVEFDRHQREIMQDQHAEHDPEHPERPRRNRSKEQPAPVFERIHGRTSFNDAN
jgi:hypothetical protein